jgi:hypothetical protein
MFMAFCSAIKQLVEERLKNANLDYFERIRYYLLLPSLQGVDLVFYREVFLNLNPKIQKQV